MSLKAFLAILVGKSVRFVCRVLHRGGTAKPGEIALRICPDLLSILSRNVKCVVITGTNGKTTCTRIVEQGMREEGLNCFANRSGANLIEGIATDFIVNSTLSGKCLCDYAVLETDEAATKRVCEQLQPQVIFVTNLFRDQVDRFGGVLNTRDNIRIGISNSPNSVLVLNGDCPVTASLAKGVPNRTVFFGFSQKAAEKNTGKGVSDLDGCVECGYRYEYSYITFSHLGKYMCPKCSSCRPEVQYEISDIVSQDITGSDIIVNNAVELSVNLPAAYNIYNGIGSYAALIECGVSRNSAAKALANFKCGFGRMEELNIGEKGGRMILVKNDAGCNQVLQFLHSYDQPFVLSIYLNNNISDGVDISWLEDAEFEILNDSKVSKIYVSGMRYEEMYKRLEKAGIPNDIIVKEPSCSDLIKALNRSSEKVFIIPTYTGMMESRTEIIKQCGGSEFWNG